MRKAENGMLYGRAAEQANFGTKVILFGLISSVMLSISPFVLVAYHWSLGKYTLNSWIFYYPIWYLFPN